MPRPLSIFASLTVDGTTDAFIMEQHIVLVGKCQAGLIDVHFIGLETTPKSDAAGVKTSVRRAVESGQGEKMTVFNKKCVAIATGRAAVMTGCKAGVVTLMKASQPSLIGIHCFSHRLELACRDVVKTNPSYQIDKFFLDIHLFYHNRYV